MSELLLTNITFHTEIAKSGGKRRIIVIPAKFFDKIEELVEEKTEVKVTIEAVTD
jgi:hypothetical protein